MAEEKPTKATGHAPKTKKQIDPTKLGITWKDGLQTNYGVIEDKIFFSTYEKPYTLIELNDLQILN